MKFTMLPSFGFDGNGDERTDSPPARPLLEAQADELRRRFPPVPASSKFAHGEFVTHRPGFSIFKRPEAMLLVFVRYLNRHNVTDLAIIKQRVVESCLNVYGPFPDCIVAYVSDEGGETMFSVMSSSIMERDRRDGTFESFQDCADVPPDPALPDPAASKQYPFVSPNFPRR